MRDINVNQSPVAEAMWDYANYKAVPLFIKFRKIHNKVVLTAYNGTEGSNPLRGRSQKL